MFRLKKINLCDGFVGLWCLYYLQNILYPQGIINQSVQLLMILQGLMPFCKCFAERQKPVLIKALLLLMIMYMVYGVLVIMFGDGIKWTSDTDYLKNSFNSLLPIFFFYEQARQGKLTEKRIQIYTLIMLLVSIVFFNYMGQLLNLENDKDENTNNAGYLFTGLIPLVFFYYKKPVFQYLLLAIMMFYVMMGLKRGAIIIGSFAVAIFLLSGLRGKSNKRKFFSLLLSSVIVVGSMYYVEYLIANSPYFMRRIDDTLSGDSSGRDYIYNAVWNAVANEQNLFYILFGHGANSTILYAGNFAHQDWLETACNNGLVGVLILAFFFITFAVSVFRSHNYFQPQYYYCFLTLLIISFSKTLFSMSIQGLDIFQSLLIGYFTYWISTRKRGTLM